MLKEAETWAEQDKLQKEKIDAKNDLEQYCYSLKLQLDDEEKLGGKLSKEDKDKINEVVEEKLKWLGDNEDAVAEDYTAAKKEIESIAQPIIAAIYQNSNQQSQDEL